MGIRWLYPLVIVLFRLDDLEAELLVKVDGRFVADLNVTVERKRDSNFQRVDTYKLKRHHNS